MRARALLLLFFISVLLLGVALIAQPTPELVAYSQVVEVKRLPMGRSKISAYSLQYKDGTAFTIMADDDLYIDKVLRQYAKVRITVEQMQ